MGYTDKFRSQHSDILEVVGDITQNIKVQADAAVLRRMLSNLAGKLNLHLAMEDKALYPRLMEMKDGDAKEVATRFMTEMGGLGGAFAAYNNKWQVSVIRKDPAGFSKESHAVFSALGKRIARENADLYPLADRAS
jgi:Hemerythrin HHE cation binding domain